MVALLHKGLRVSLDDFEGGAPVPPLPTAYDKRPEYRELIGLIEGLRTSEARRFAIRTFIPITEALRAEKGWTRRRSWRRVPNRRAFEQGVI